MLKADENRINYGCKLSCIDDASSFFVNRS